MDAAPTFAPPANATPMLVSDAEREYTVDLLREHCVAGRLTLDELEARSEEAFAARYAGDLWRATRALPVARALAPSTVGDCRRGEAIGSLVLSALGAVLLVFSFGLLFAVTLPLSVAGWLMGRAVRQDPAVRRGRGTALAGEVLGAVAAVPAGWALAAIVLVALSA